MLLQILHITAPVFLIGFSGWVWAKLEAPFDLEFITKVALFYSTPCLIFSVLVKADIDPEAFSAIALATLAAYALAGLGVAIALRLSGQSQRTWWAPTTFGNTGNLGLPLALFAFGEQGLALAVIVFAVMAVLSFTVGIYVVAGAGRPTEMLRQPLVYASVLGGIFAFNGWTVPGWLLATLELAGQIAIPLMLLTLGVSMARLKVGELGHAFLLSLVKLAICSAAALLTAWAFGLADTARGVLILQLITPAAVTSYLVAERYQRAPKAVAGLVVVSTLISILAIPATLAWLLH